MKLELRNVTKRFGSLIANDSITLTVEPGEIHGLLGENGAGKSTLMNVLYGLYSPDEGEILLDGVPHSFGSPADALEAGIGMVHQHFMLVPVFTVAENLMLGHESTTFGGRLDLDAARRRVREISARFGFEIDPDARIEDIPVGVQQRVEIIKALSHNAKMLILDEPTAVLTPSETDELITIMNQLREEGVTIVFISHKLREVRAVADRITVIRRGRVVAESEPTASNSELAALMVGRQVELTLAREAAAPKEIVLETHELSAVDGVGHRVVDEVSLSVRAGEVLAIAGVQGNGQSELIDVLSGLHPISAGRATIDGRNIEGRTVREILGQGVGLIPEDRHADAIIGDFTLSENLVLNRLDDSIFVRQGTLRLRAIEQFASKQISQFDVRPANPTAQIRTLSGGNQQKVVVARELSRPLRLLIAAQPTRGLDVGSIEFVHRSIMAARDEGTAVIVVSTELDEVLNLADRIAVMYRGRVIGIVPGTTSRDDLGLMMAGVMPAHLEEAS